MTDSSSLDDLLKASPESIRATLRAMKWQHVERLLDEAEARLRGDPNWRRSPIRVQNHFKRYVSALTMDDVLDRRVLDFGCGAFNPLVISLLFFLNGAKKTVAVDIEACADELIARGLYHFVRECSACPEEYCFWDTSVGDLKSRLSVVDAAASRSGDWRRALRDAPIVYKAGGSEDLLLECGEVDLVVSQSVLEHVMQFAPVAHRFSQILSPEGVMAHYVDFNDHDRKVNRSKLSRWAFLTTDKTRGARHSNRIRLTEMVAVFQEAGFSTEVLQSVEMPVPDNLRDHLLPRFRSLSDLDLRTIGALLRVKKDVKTPGACTE